MFNKNYPQVNDFIDFSNRSGASMARTLDAVMDMLLIAGKYNGKVFGGFVRDVIIPTDSLSKSLDELIVPPNERYDVTRIVRDVAMNLATATHAKITFKDVDVWFTKEADAKLFVEEMGAQLGNFNEDDKFPRDISHYEFKQWFGVLKQGNLAVSYVDIIINEAFPVNDFDVNCVSVRYWKDTGGNICYDMVCHGHELSDIVDAITKKTMTMKKEYLEKITKREESHSYTKSWTIGLINTRITERYLGNGWTVLVPSREDPRTCIPLSLRGRRARIEDHL